MLKKLGLAIMLMAGISNAQAYCNFGWAFGFDHLPADDKGGYMLLGQNVDAAIHGNTMSEGEYVRFTWAREGDSSYARTVVRSMQWCPNGNCAPGTLVAGDLWKPPARGQWYVAVRDNAFGSNPSTCLSSYFVVQKAPTAVIASITGTMRKNETITFTGDGTMDNNAKNSSLRYHWNFGDGTTAQGRVVTHSYTTGGSKTAKLRTFDGKFYSPWVPQTVPIANDPPPPEWCGPGTPYQCK